MNEKITNITYESKTIVSHTIYTFTIKYNYIWEGFGGITQEATNNRSLTIHQQPTGNCQLSTLCTFVNIVCFQNDDLLKIFKLIYQKAYVKLLLFDINEEYIDRLENLFSKKYICFKNKYTSTNNSEMCLFGINLKQFIYDMTPPEEVKNDYINNLADLVEENQVARNVDSDFGEILNEELPTIQKVTRIKPKRDSYEIHHISPHQRKQIRNISNIHKF